MDSPRDRARGISLAGGLRRIHHQRGAYRKDAGVCIASGGAPSGDDVSGGVGAIVTEGAGGIG